MVSQLAKAMLTIWIKSSAVTFSVLSHYSLGCFSRAPDYSKSCRNGTYSLSVESLVFPSLGDLCVSVVSILKKPQRQKPQRHRVKER